MKLYFFDDTPAISGEPHGPLGLTHCGTATVDYEYQVEQTVIDAGRDHPKIIRITCPELGCSWKRISSTSFEEVYDNQNETDSSSVHASGSGSIGGDPKS